MNKKLQAQFKKFTKDILLLTYSKKELKNFNENFEKAFQTYRDKELSWALMNIVAIISNSGYKKISKITGAISIIAPLISKDFEEKKICDYLFGDANVIKKQIRGENFLEENKGNIKLSFALLTINLFIKTKTYSKNNQKYIKLFKEFLGKHINNTDINNTKDKNLSGLFKTEVDLIKAEDKGMDSVNSILFSILRDLDINNKFFNAIIDNIFSGNDRDLINTMTIQGQSLASALINTKNKLQNKNIFSIIDKIDPVIFQSTNSFFYNKEKKNIKKNGKAYNSILEMQLDSKIDSRCQVTPLADAIMRFYLSEDKNDRLNVVISLCQNFNKLYSEGKEQAYITDLLNSFIEIKKDGRNFYKTPLDGLIDIAKVITDKKNEEIVEKTINLMKDKYQARTLNELKDYTLENLKNYKNVSEIHRVKITRDINKQFPEFNSLEVIKSFKEKRVISLKERAEILKKDIETENLFSFGTMKYGLGEEKILDKIKNVFKWMRKSVDRAFLFIFVSKKDQKEIREYRKKRRKEKNTIIKKKKKNETTIANDIVNFFEETRNRNWVQKFNETIKSVIKWIGREFEKIAQKNRKYKNIIRDKDKQKLSQEKVFDKSHDVYRGMPEYQKHIGKKSKEFTRNLIGQSKRKSRSK